MNEPPGNDCRSSACPTSPRAASERVIGALEATLGGYARILNRHSDAEHNRSVFTIAAEPDKLVEALVAGAEHAIDLIDLRGHQGLHPHIGALDVCPVVWQTEDRRDDARAAARKAAEGIAATRDPGLPLRRARHQPGAPRARLLPPGRPRRAGAADGVRRASARPRAPPSPIRRAGATLVTAREPLVAFNVELDTPNPEIARADRRRAARGGWRAARRAGARACRASGGARRSRSTSTTRRRAAREGGRGDLPARRASTAPGRSRPSWSASRPEAALEGYPDEPPIRDFDPKRDVIENVLG